MNDSAATQGDEWRVEVGLDEAHGTALGHRLTTARLDEEAEKTLGSSVIVTHDGSHLFAYTNSEAAARHAEAAIRQLLEAESAGAEVRVTRWHPVEEAWKDAASPLPESEEEAAAERARHAAAELADEDDTGEADWEVAVHVESLSDMLELDRKLRDQGFPVDRRWKYLLVGAPTEERAEALADTVRGLAPDTATVDVIVNPDDLPNPIFVAIGALASRIRDRL